MELLKGIIAEDLFLYLPEHKVFILSDIHIGYEESLNRQGILVPRNNYDDLALRLEKILKRIKTRGIAKIVLNGDIVHEFGKVPSKEKDLVRRFMGFLSSYAELIIIRGNHDNALKYVLAEDVDIVDKAIFGGILVTHGDRILPKEWLKGINTIIIGHEHPSISIKSGARTERYKCFLSGKYSGRNLVVMPSCNLFLEGSDVMKEKLLSPILKEVSITGFKAYVVEDKVYDFGKIGALIRKMGV